MQITPRVPTTRVLIAISITLTVILAVGLRVYRLDDVPVFYDEDRYAFVAYEMTQMSWADALRRPMDYPETGIARAPLVLLGQAMLASVTNDTVVAGRLISVVSASITTVLSFWLGRHLAGPVAGVVTSLLYAVSPIAILHEQMGLQDGPLTAVAVAAVLVSMRAVVHASWIAATAAAILGAIAVQCKPPGVALALVPPMLLLLWPSSRQRLGPAALASAGPALSYAAVALGPLGASMAEEDSRIRLIRPLEMVPENLFTSVDTLVTYFSIGLLIFMVLGRVIAGRDAPRQAVAFSWAIIVFIVPWLILSRFVPSRYYLPAIPFLCAFAAVALVMIPRLLWNGRRWAGALATAASVAIVLQHASAGLARVIEPRTAPLSRLDDGQYRSGWPSGFAYMDAAGFLRTSVIPNAVVAYAIDSGHRMGAGTYSSLPNGMTSLGLIDVAAPSTRAEGRTLVVMVDDSTEPPLQRASLVMQREPELRLAARFENPGSKLGVSILTNGVSR